ncbi:hypothetical protein [Paucibacter sp. Y2R2-4]|uniref:hypothetical protein n=1 Tax=Paucibacter sp. Y2R2-4 TaxID=2893553 RepID=UPI0021E3B599|nr:hypothetical protein [Paucibacter sp. Y2R2-4]MCV2350823.1 hypothetical protein [Paucibacter sp. Y2R2-4]
MVKLVDSTPWIPLIGRLFIAFGSIERTSHDCIREWAGEKIHKHFAKASLSARLALIADLCESREASESTKKAFSAAVSEARSLSKYRNLVAHNPLCLVFLQGDLDTQVLEAIASNVDDKHLRLEDLSKIAESAERCETKLLQAFVTFRAEALDLEHIEHFPGLGSRDG